MFELRSNYIAVLESLRSGPPKTSAEISADTGIDMLQVVGAISILRRTDAVAQAGNKKYRITDKGKSLFDTRPGIEVNRRQT
jgi:predicted transcriptional regulator